MGCFCTSLICLELPNAGDEVFIVATRTGEHEAVAILMHYDEAWYAHFHLSNVSIFIK